MRKRPIPTLTLTAPIYLHYEVQAYAILVDTRSDTEQICYLGIPRCQKMRVFVYIVAISIYLATFSYLLLGALGFSFGLRVASNTFAEEGLDFSEPPFLFCWAHSFGLVCTSSGESNIEPRFF